MIVFHHEINLKRATLKCLTIVTNEIIFIIHKNKKEDIIS
ncbi:hypothetical protein QY96_03813 [Bacillus thermotolerans]|nr:hypothetical protein QY96_03813 [Bacillus thermotolerans]